MYVRHSLISRAGGRSQDLCHHLPRAREDQAAGTQLGAQRGPLLAPAATHCCSSKSHPSPSVKWGWVIGHQPASASRSPPWAVALEPALPSSLQSVPSSTTSVRSESQVVGSSFAHLRPRTVPKGPYCFCHHCDIRLTLPYLVVSALHHSGLWLRGLYTQTHTHTHSCRSVLLAPTHMTAPTTGVNPSPSSAPCPTRYLTLCTSPCI